MTPKQKTETELRTYSQHLDYLNTLEQSKERDSLIDFIQNRAQKYTNGDLHVLDIRLSKKDALSFLEWEAQKKYETDESEENKYSLPKIEFDF